MKRMKKNIFKWLPIFVVVALCVGFVSCGDDDDDDNNGGLITPTLDDASKFFVGNWVENDGEYVRYFTFSADGNDVFVSNKLLYGYEDGNLVEKEKSVVKRTGTWHFEKASERTGVLYTGISGYEVISVMDMSEGYWYGISTSGYEITARKLADNDYAINHYKENVFTDYAPNDVSGKHFKLDYSSTTYNLYFTSNSTTNPASNAGVDVMIVNATYEKTLENKARITITTGGSTYSFHLTFTSNSGGKFSWGSLEYNFTMDDAQPSTNFSAPTSIAYKTFTESSLRWLSFGSQSGSRVYVNSFKWGFSSNYSDNFIVTYNKTSTRQATLVVEHTFKLIPSSSPTTDTWTYNLTFTSENGGNYSRTGTSTNFRRTSAEMSGSGAFTLQ